jgi:hypothetical protein
MTGEVCGLVGTVAWDLVMIPSPTQVWCAVEAVDMRMGMDGLSLRVQQALGKQPCDDSAYAFCNRRGNRLKLLVWTLPASGFASAAFPGAASSDRRLAHTQRTLRNQLQRPSARIGNAAGIYTRPHRTHLQCIDQKPRVRCRRSKKETEETSVHYSVTAQDLQTRQEDDFEVKSSRLPVYIVDVHAHFLRNGQFVTAVYLRPTREARPDPVHTLFRSHRNQVMLIEQRGARADHAHITTNNAPKLRKFI